MNPKPLASLNHFTVPVCISKITSITVEKKRVQTERRTGERLRGGFYDDQISVPQLPNTSCPRRYRYPETRPVALVSGVSPPLYGALIKAYNAPEVQAPGRVPG
jgi:hypothetical protein